MGTPFIPLCAIIAVLIIAFLFDDYRQIDTHKMTNYTFIDATFNEIDVLIVV